MAVEKWSERKALREYYQTLIDEQTNIKLEIEMVFDRLRYLDDRDTDIKMQYDPSNKDDLFETETFKDPTQQIIKELDDEIQDSHFPKENKEEEHGDNYPKSQEEFDLIKKREEIESKLKEKRNHSEYGKEYLDDSHEDNRKETKESTNYKNALQMLKEQKERNILDVENDTKVPTKLVDELKAKDNRDNFKKDNNNNLIFKDKFTLANMVGSILQDNGVPMKLNKIMEEFESRGYFANNPTEIMNRAMEANYKIERVLHGTYQYREHIKIV